MVVPDYYRQEVSYVIDATCRLLHADYVLLFMYTGDFYDLSLCRHGLNSHEFYSCSAVDKVDRIEF